jgi:hypothetical protein
MMPIMLRPFVLLALLFVAIMGAGTVVQPGPVRTTNVAGAFDATDALARLARVLGDEAPHPTDSAAQDEVRARLIAEIEALGASPILRDQFACRAQPHLPTIDCMRVRNIVFSIGPESGPAILAAAHYDSVPAGPGASDDGIGIAAWLEVARALKTAPLRRRVIFLFSDAEEPALLGAKLFAESDPLMAEVRSIINLEARGTSGPAAFFETNRPNGDSVRAFAQGAPRPLASSIMADIYRLLPNDTDVTMLRREGLDIVNVAILGNVENYHTPRDSLASFDPRSLQHMGDIALGVTRAFAAGADQGTQSSFAFTDIASIGFIAVPEIAGPIVLGLGAVVALFFFWSRGPAGRWKALSAPVLIIAIAALLAFGVDVLMGLVRPGETYWFAYPQATRAWCALAALFATSAVLMLLGRRPRGEHVGAAAWFWLALLGFGGSFYLPGLPILFLPSAAIYAIGLIASRFWAPARALGAIGAASFMLILWAPTIYLTELALGFELPFAIAALMSLACLAWLGPLAALQRDGSWRPAALIFGCAMLVAIGAAAALPAYTIAKPRPFNIVYLQDATTQDARFIAGSVTRALPPALANAATFEPAPATPGDQIMSWSAPAPYAALPSADFAVALDASTNEERVVRGTLVANGAYRIILRIPRSAEPRRVTINGVEADFAATAEIGDYVNFACSGRACDGALVEIGLGATADHAEWYVLGQYPGAPAVSAPLLDARPSNMIPIQFGDIALTLTRKAM